MTARRTLDVLIVSPGATLGLRRAAHELAGSLQGLGYDVDVLLLRETDGWSPPGWLPNAAGELFEAAALRRKTLRALKEVDVRSLVYGTSIATVFQPRACVARAAVWMDQPASVNRRGLRNAPQRLLERRQLERARLLLPWSRLGAEHLRARYRTPVVPLPPPVAPSAAAGERRDRAICYAGNPEKKGLDLIVRAFALAGISRAELLVAGIDERSARSFLERRSVDVPAGVRFVGCLSSGEFRRAVAESAVYVSAARREEYGIALLEALADGTLLVALPPAWTIEPIELGRDLDPELVTRVRSVEALAASLGRAFAYSEEERLAYQRRATRALRQESSAELQRRLREEVLPLLLEGGS